MMLAAFNRTPLVFVIELPDGTVVREIEVRDGQFKEYPLDGDGPWIVRVGDQKREVRDPGCIVGGMLLDDNTFFLDAANRVSM